MAQQVKHTVSDAATEIVDGSKQSPEHFATPAVRNGKDKVSAKPVDDGSDDFFMLTQDSEGKTGQVSVSKLASDYAKAVYGVNRFQRDILMELLSTFKHHETPREAIAAFWPKVQEAYYKLDKIQPRNAAMSPAEREENSARRQLSTKTLAVYSSMANRVISAALGEFDDKGSWDELLENMKQEKNFTKFVTKLPLLSGRPSKSQGRVDGPEAQRGIKQLQAKAEKEGFKLVPVAGKLEEAPQSNLKADLVTPAAEKIITAMGGQTNALTACITFIHSITDEEILNTVAQAVGVRYRDAFSRAYNERHPEDTFKTHPIYRALNDLLMQYTNEKDEAEATQEAAEADDADETTGDEPKRKSA